MISVQNVSKSFGPVEALRNVSFEIKPGEVVGFLGPNGAGKTTMMRLLTGFFPPTQGIILINGQNLFRARLELRKQIGYLPENNPLYKEMTAQSFLSYAASLKGIFGKGKRHVIDEVTEQCGIGSVRNRIIGKLSKGFQQRVGLAQALLGDPDILVLDEPTNGLDPAQIIEIRNLIRKLGKERTILLSTHILPEVQATCERVLILNRGELVASGTPESLESRMRRFDEFLLQVRGTWTEGENFLKRIPGILEVRLERESGGEREYRIRAERGSEVRSKLARTALDSGFELLSLKETEWNLEDIFLKIVKEETASA